MESLTMDELIIKAEKLFSEGAAAEARKLLEEVLTKEPGNPRALVDLGVIRHSGGDQSGARELLTRALELEPFHLEAGHTLAVILATQGRWEEVTRLLQRFLATYPDKPELWELAAKAEASLDHLNEAVAHMEKAVALDPEQPRLKDGLARLLDRRKLSGRALKSFLFCRTGMDHFAKPIIQYLKPRIEIGQVTGDSLPVFTGPAAGAGLIWLEWGDELAHALSQAPGLLNGKRVVLRLHSYEVIGGLARRIDFANIQDVVCVSRLIRELFLASGPNLPPSTRLHVIHNGIDLARFPLKKEFGRNKIAFVGGLNAKKDPMVLMQAFAFLKRRHPELELHVAGDVTVNHYKLAIPHFLETNGLESSARLYGHISDIPRWLEDKDYIICASPFESQGVGLLEAMARGLRPLIRNFPGAEDIYPKNYVWNDFDGLDELLSNGPEPQACHDFVAKNYSLERLGDHFFEVLKGGGPVIEEKIDLGQ